MTTSKIVATQAVAMETRAARNYLLAVDAKALQLQVCVIDPPACLDPLWRRLRRRPELQEHQRDAKVGLGSSWDANTASSRLRE